MRATDFSQFASFSASGSLQDLITEAPPWIVCRRMKDRRFEDLRSESEGFFVRISASAFQ